MNFPTDPMMMKYLKANYSKHLDKAATNERLSLELNQLEEQYFEWQIITLFYSAVHLVQAYLRARTTEYPQTHEERDRLIRNTAELRAIYQPYQELKRLAVTARYACLPTNKFDVDGARTQLKIVQAHIAKLLA